MEALATWFPRLRAIPRSEFREVQISEMGRDLSLLLGIRNYYWDNYVDFKLIRPLLAHEVKGAAGQDDVPGKCPTGGPDMIFEHPDQRLPCAVMFRDSFATWLIPLLSEHFRRIVYTWQYTLDQGIVERERPDVVIQEMVERVLLSNPLPSP